jgi:hypothetical protein
MHHVRDNDGVMALGNWVPKKVALHNLNALRQRVGGQTVAGYRRDRGRLKERACQVGVPAEHGHEKRPRASTEVQHAAVSAEVIARGEHLRGPGGNGLHALRVYLLLRGGERKLPEDGLTGADRLFQFRPPG